tara:strand:+ start:5933 stop:7318 length:1386 start_codon:yes stop_codon:yes gene_type:complete
MVTGKDLIRLGYKPSKWFSEAIKSLNEYPWNDSKASDEAIKIICDRLLPPPVIMPHKSPKPYRLNLDASNADELKNRKMVTNTMDILMKTPTVLEGSIMPDACPTGRLGQIPVGGVVVTKNAIHPNMHSADVCCSMYSSELDFIDPKKVLDVAEKATHFGHGGRTDGLYTLHEYLLDLFERNPFLNSPKTLAKAKSHLGTQGDGNHFLFVGKSEKTGKTMMVTHHGSRGVGADLYKAGIKVAERYRKELSPDTDPLNAWIPSDTKDGKDYWDALLIVKMWTRLNHRVIHEEVMENLGIFNTNNIWNPHNFVFKSGERYYHAKGATPLSWHHVPDGHADDLRLIPLNMSQPVLIVKGEYSETNIGFAPHGAGRNISRSEHSRRMATTGMTKEDVFKKETAGLDVRFFSGEIDLTELPSAYKNAHEVVEQIEKYNLAQVVDRIMPYGSIMAGHQDAPWKRKKK